MKKFGWVLTALLAFCVSVPANAGPYSWLHGNQPKPESGAYDAVTYYHGNGILQGKGPENSVNDGTVRNYEFRRPLRTDRALDLMYRMEKNVRADITDGFKALDGRVKKLETVPPPPTVVRPQWEWWWLIPIIIGLLLLAALVWAIVEALRRRNQPAPTPPAVPPPGPAQPGNIPPVPTPLPQGRGGQPNGHYGGGRGGGGSAQVNLYLGPDASGRQVIQRLDSKGEPMGKALVVKKKDGSCVCPTEPKAEPASSCHAKVFGKLGRKVDAISQKLDDHIGEQGRRWDEQAKAWTTNSEILQRQTRALEILAENDRQRRESIEQSERRAREFAQSTAEAFGRLENRQKC